MQFEIETDPPETPRDVATGQEAFMVVGRDRIWVYPATTRSLDDPKEAPKVKKRSLCMRRDNLQKVTIYELVHTFAEEDGSCINLGFPFWHLENANRILKRIVEANGLEGDLIEGDSEYASRFSSWESVEYLSVICWITHRC